MRSPARHTTRARRCRQHVPRRPCTSLSRLSTAVLMCDIERAIYVRLSVCLSVCLLRLGIVSKWHNHRYFLQRMTAPLF